MTGKMDKDGMSGKGGNSWRETSTNMGLEASGQPCIGSCS